MSRFERRASLVIAAVALCGALAPAPPESPAKAPSEPLAANIPLAKEQLRLIDQITADLDRSYKSGEVGLTSPGFKLWARRKIDALRSTGAGKEAIVAELEHYVAFMRKQESAWKTLYKQNEATRIDAAAAQYDRLEAEMWLNQEKAR
jgi:hypothetical protein